MRTKQMEQFADNPIPQEHGLTWISALLTKGNPLPDFSHAVLADIDSDSMYPALPKGTRVIAQPLHEGELILPGVYLWKPTTYQGNSLCLGRLVELHPTWLKFATDNWQTETICPLEWENPGFKLYRIAFIDSIAIR